MEIDTTVRESAVQRSMNRNNYMLSARDIFRTLKELRQNKKLSNRRWVWELLQNAKDVRNRFERVSVVVEHTPTHLRFRHNGNPFSIDNLTCLIQQVSSKLSDSSDEEQTGRWGTGFISTHLLATIINVTGIVDCEGRGFRRFSLPLDRSGDTAEKLLESIRTTSLEVLRLEDDDEAFPPQPQYEERRQETDFDTEFSYELIALENQEAAIAGIADLVLTLPSALLNIPKQKIKSVQVKQLDGTTLTFDVELGPIQGNVTGYTVTSSVDTPGAVQTRRYFYAYETPELRLLAEVTDFTVAVPNLVPPRADQPVLYRDFPLIGSERFHFPFALNSSEFYPNERRDGIFLNATEDKETLRNRALLAAAQTAALDFTGWLLERGVGNRYVLSNTRVPEVPGDGLDAEARAWYEQLQTAWRRELLGLPLVETENEVGIAVPLQQVRIPRFRANAKPADNLTLWKLAAAFLGADAVPRQDLLQDWIAALGVTEEMHSWGSKPLFLDTTGLLGLVADKERLADMPMTIAEGGSEAASLAWLNELYAFLAAQGELEQLRHFAAVPNQEGTLCKLDTLFVERPDELIPAEVLDVLHSLDKKWRTDLVPREVVLPGYKHQDRGLREASTEILQVLKVRENPADTLDMAFLKRADAPSVLVAILRLTSSNAEDTALRSQLFRFAKDLLHFEADVTQVPSLKYFSFDKATQLLTLHVNQTISNTKTLSGLAAALHLESADDARDWLARYLSFAYSGNRALMEYGNIVPNQEEQLCPYKELYNAGTREQPLDDALVAILKACDAQQDWKPRLLAKNVSLELTRRFTFDELGNALTAFANTTLATDDYKQHMKPLLRLLEWCQASDRNKELARIYLGKFNERLSSHWFTLTMEGSGKGTQVMRLLHNPERIDHLVAIAESGTDLGKLSQLAQMTTSDAILNQVLRYASQLESDVASFRFLQSIGAEMEAAFKNALREEGITVDIKHGEGAAATVAQIDYKGIGSYDFAVRNPANDKAFYIELKSHAQDNPHPIRLAKSQAKRAAAGTEPFALCVVGRNRPAEEVDAAYVRDELIYVKDLHLQPDFTPVAGHIQQLEALETHNPAVWLDVTPLNESKVFVTHEFIQARRHPFTELVADIKVAIQ